MKKIIFIGSAGFVGGNFLRKFLFDQNQKPYQDRYTLSSIDRINGSPNSIYANKSHQLYIADITDRHIIDTIFQFEKPDVIIHGAEEQSGHSMVASNVVGTQVLIDACVKYNTKLIYLSADKVYGDLKDNGPYTEVIPVSPSTSYAASKAAGELLVKASNLSWNIVRSSNCYGNRQLSSKLIPMTIKCILEDRKIPIYSNGNNVRDWLHVVDNYSAIMTILEKGEDRSIYNVSASQEFTDLEVVHEICKYMGKGHELIEFVTANEHKDSRRALDTDKLKNLGWKSAYKFKEAIPNVCQWTLDNSWCLSQK